MAVASPTIRVAWLEIPDQLRARFPQCRIKQLPGHHPGAPMGVPVRKIHTGKGKVIYRANIRISLI